MKSLFEKLFLNFIEAYIIHNIIHQATCIKSKGFTMMQKMVQQSFSKQNSEEMFFFPPEQYRNLAF